MLFLQFFLPIINFILLCAFSFKVNSPPLFNIQQWTLYDSLQNVFSHSCQLVIAPMPENSSAGSLFTHLPQTSCVACIHGSVLFSVHHPIVTIRKELLLLNACQGPHGHCLSPLQKGRVPPAKCMPGPKSALPLLQQYTPNSTSHERSCI